MPPEPSKLFSPFSYYGLYLLDYLRTNKFEQADDTAFIRERADRAAETYEKARLEGYPADGAQELAMDTLLRGLRYSRYDILREVVENEFSDEVPEEKREAMRMATATNTTAGKIEAVI